MLSIYGRAECIITAMLAASEDEVKRITESPASKGRNDSIPRMESIRDGRARMNELAKFEASHPSVFDARDPSRLLEQSAHLRLKRSPCVRVPVRI